MTKVDGKLLQYMYVCEKPSGQLIGLIVMSHCLVEV
jgi:hypothetical protein